MPCLPNWSIKGPFIYASPTQHILRGLCFEGSGFDSVTFYMTVFFLPLCVPTKIVSLTFGKRLRRAKGESWDKNDPELISALRMAVTREALPFLSEVESLPSDVLPENETSQNEKNRVACSPPTQEGSHEEEQVL